MAGSEAEERIRAKVVEMLRLRWPEARVIHELVLVQGGVRLDVAAVTPDHLCIVEIKSERDSLERLPAQLALATQVANEVWVCAAPKHEEALADAWRWKGYDDFDVPVKRALRQTRVFLERSQADPFLQATHGAHSVPALWPDPRRQAQVLWADELRVALGPHGGGRDKANMGTNCRRMTQWLTGQQIQTAMCAALLSRPFARADEPHPGIDP